MSRSALIIHNPFSGRGKSHKVLEELLPGLDQVQVRYKVIQTEDNPEEPDYLDAELEADTTDIIVIGGDGTLHHVLNHLKNQDLVWNLIPAGTGNDFVKNLSIGKNLTQQIRTIPTGKPIRVDVGKINDKLFINGVGIGFDGQIVSDMLHKKSWLKGHARYYYFVLRILASFKPKLLKYVSGDLVVESQTLLMAIANGTTYGGGFKLAPKANISDGLLDICHIGDISPLRRFLNIPRLSVGTHDALNEVKMHKTNTVEIDGAYSLQAQVDGEPFGAPPYSVKVLPGYLKIRSGDQS